MVSMDMMTCEYSISTVFMNLYPTIVQSCWIDTEKGAIWGFVAPMLGIIIVSFVCTALYVVQ